jgi:hypothetical protein
VHDGAMPNERRSRHRIPIDESASLQMLRPVSLDWLQVQILDASDGGMCLTCPAFLPVGADVKIRKGRTFAFGKIRYCVPSQSVFRVGIQVSETMVTGSVTERAGDSIATDPIKTL